VNRRSVLLVTGIILLALPGRAQSVADAVEAIQHARVATRILYVDAHPDDESSATLAYLARGLGANVALLSVTRGRGGQNAVGPEQGEALGVVRTAELLAAARDYGVRVYFTRAVDFGYSKTAEETLRIWGQVPFEDITRVIRVFRPEIVINAWGGVHTGHGQHQATGLLVPEAVAAAADATKFPGQLAEGLRPWHVSVILRLRRGGEGEAGGWDVPIDRISPLRGKSYSAIGLEGLVHHRSQGIPAFVNSPFLRRRIALIPTSWGRFDPQQLAEPLASLGARFPDFSPLLVPALARADEDLQAGRQAALALDWPAAARHLAAAGETMARSEAELARAAGPAEERADARWELEQARARADRALALAAALRLTARADRNDLVAGESFHVRLEWSDRRDVPLEIGAASLVVPPGWQVTQEERAAGEAAEPAAAAEHEPMRTAHRAAPMKLNAAEFTVAVPAGAAPPRSPDDVIDPWPAPLVRGRLAITITGYRFDFDVPAKSLRATSTADQLLPLALVPAISLTTDPQQLMLPGKTAGLKPLVLLVRVHDAATAPAKISLGLDAPEGWGLAPAAPLDFSGPGDQLARLVVLPPSRPGPGAYTLAPFARRGAETFRTAIEPVPEVPGRFVEHSAQTVVHVLPLALPRELRVGYVAAGDDPVPETLRQLGIQVEMLDEPELAFGNLSRFDAIVIGIRAYELRSDVARANARLLRYVAEGGTLVVQYERDFAWDRLEPAPYPATMERPAPRVTDENSPVRFLLPSSPLLNFPNEITASDFAGWVQERGLYFWNRFDRRYEAVLGMHDPGEQETTGSLVDARYGKGLYIYTGLAFFRQLPAGVPGAYRLFVNLLSQSRR
jgi:LmbE family N-acetylglucosaminyl deacetylase